MSDAPEKIRTNAAGNAIVTPHPVWDTDVEYIRADVAQAMVAAAYDKGAKDDPVNYYPPKDARAALDAMLAKAREDTLREAAEEAKGWGNSRIAQIILSLIDRTADRQENHT